MSVLVADAEELEERVAVQAAVLATLRRVAGCETVWPGATMVSLALSGRGATAAAQALSAELHVRLDVSDLAAEPTVATLIDRVLGAER